MKSRVADWREEHLRFAKLLDMLESQLDSFHLAEKPNYELMLEVMRSMSRYPEDVEGFRREREAIRKAGGKLVEMLEEVLDDAVLARHEVEEPGREYIRRLRAQMRREEARQVA